VTFDSSLICAKIDDEVATSMRWFAKGLAEDAVIDEHAFYWIAFEILASSWPGVDAKTALKYPKCPNCGEDTQTRPLTAERISRVGIGILKIDEETIEKLYKTRHLMHGTMRLQNASEIENLSGLTQQLKAAKGPRLVLTGAIAQTGGHLDGCFPRRIELPFSEGFVERPAFARRIRFESVASRCEISS
jgi:hypothetical protein